MSRVSGMPLLRWLPFVVLAVLSLLAEPIRAGFTLAMQGCEAVPTGEQFAATFGNVKHLVSFFVLFLAAAFAVRPPVLIKAALLTFAVSALVELEQAVLQTGHCRAWDLIPNLMAIGFGALCVGGAAWLLRRARA